MAWARPKPQAEQAYVRRSDRRPLPYTRHGRIDAVSADILRAKRRRDAGLLALALASCAVLVVLMQQAPVCSASSMPPTSITIGGVVKVAGC
jgi:hypothetical protein